MAPRLQRPVIGRAQIRTGPGSDDSDGQRAVETGPTERAFGPVTGSSTKGVEPLRAGTRIGFRTAAALACALCVWAAGPSFAGPLDPEREHAGSRDVTSGVRIVDMPGTYWELYPTNEDIVVQNVDRLKRGVGVALTLRSDMAGFSHYLYAPNGEAARRAKGNVVTVAVPDLHLPGIRQATLVVRAVAKDGRESRPYAMLLGYYPSTFYQAYGKTESSHITVQITDLVFGSRRVRDAVSQNPTDSDRSYARRRWADVVRSDAPDYEAAVRLARCILSDLEPHRGMPSDAMDGLMPFQQYERVMAGEDEVFCLNIAAIFSYACNALGIPCRNVGMGRPEQLNAHGTAGDYALSCSPAHVTTEIFSRRLNQWVWMDPFLGVLGAHLDGQDLVDTVEFQMMLNNPNRAKRLKVREYDAASDSLRTVPLYESARYRELLNYYKKDQRFFYYTRDHDRPSS